MAIAFDKLNLKDQTGIVVLTRSGLGGDGKGRV